MRIKKFKDLSKLKVEIEEFESYRIFKVVNSEGDKISSFTIDKDMEGDSEEFDLAYLQALSLKEEFRGKGLSKILFKPLVREVKNFGYNSIFLTVSKENKPAINLYTSLGFKIVKNFNRKSKDSTLDMILEF